MKKKIMGIIAIVVVATVAGYNVYTSQNNVRLSDLVLANIEALANDGESGYSCSATANCYYGGRVEGSVSCTGKVSCTSGYEYVKCDGRTNYCS
ncbi:NVEALA domain-containing protein [Bacteroides sp. AN502(2024)]|uniref:NVEALA domain-containing protein n=1 Tax=Bacteroides sp. AN502(2024) TaxID=3160599 RepID=UPI003518C539